MTGHLHTLGTLMTTVQEGGCYSAPKETMSCSVKKSIILVQNPLKFYPYVKIKSNEYHQLTIYFEEK